MTALASLTRTAPPQGLQHDLDLLAAVITIERIRTALNDGNEILALWIVRDRLLDGDGERLRAHIHPVTWARIHLAAGDLPGTSAWLTEAAADLERQRARRPGLLERWVRRG